MFKINWLLLFSLTFSVCSAQNKKPTTQWKTEILHIVDLSTKSKENNLHQYYHKKIENGNLGIQSKFPFNKPSYLNSIVLQPYSLKELNWVYHHQSNPEIYNDIFKEDTAAFTQKSFYYNNLSLFEIKQELTLKENQLFIQNKWAKPIYYSKEKGTNRDATKFFASKEIIPIGIQTLSKKQIPASAIFISRVYNKIWIEAKKNTPTLAKLLEKLVVEEKLKAFDPLNNEWPPISYINKDSLDFFNNPIQSIEQVDSNGNLSMTQYVIEAIDLDKVENYLLLQDIYFDFTSGILYAIPVQIVLLKPTEYIDGDNLYKEIFWGVYFD